MIGRLTALLLLTAAAPALALDPQAPESCATGPVTKTYGGTPWLVASCSDGKSLVFVAKDGSPAAPFEFDLTYTGDGYDMTGRGKGDRKYTDAAYAELSKLTGDAVRALVDETRKAPKIHP
ncbi:MAG: hypothetical protein JOZ72_08010 [Alphaproteobacteria bacterium]|nr:hypothetical protein [Alphaproteobacteria bacterium]